MTKFKRIKVQGTNDDNEEIIIKATNERELMVKSMSQNDLLQAIYEELKEINKTLKKIYN